MDGDKCSICEKGIFRAVYEPNKKYLQCDNPVCGFVYGIKGTGSYVCSKCGKGGLTDKDKTIITGLRDIYSNGIPNGNQTTRFGKICEICSAKREANPSQTSKKTLEDSIDSDEFIKESPKIIPGLTPEFPPLYIESESERIETTKQSLGSILYKQPDVRMWIGRVNTTTRKNQHTLYDF